MVEIRINPEFLNQITVAVNETDPHKSIAVFGALYREVYREVQKPARYSEETGQPVEWKWTPRECWDGDLSVLHHLGLPTTIETWLKKEISEGQMLVLKDSNIVAEYVPTRSIYTSSMWGGEPTPSSVAAHIRIVRCMEF